MSDPRAARYGKEDFPPEVAFSPNDLPPPHDSGTVDTEIPPPERPTSSPTALDRPLWLQIARGFAWAYVAFFAVWFICESPLFEGTWIGGLFEFMK